MRAYKVIWSFIDNDGVRTIPGQEYQYEERYGNSLKGKGLVIEADKKQQPTENKAADTSDIETKPARRGRPPKTEGGKS